jgi:hypothetical protein
MNARKLAVLWERLRRSLRDAPSDNEFQAEIEAHIGLLAERYRRQGMTADAAMLAARRQFGNTTLLQEDRRGMQSMPAIERLRGDLMYTVRTLRKNPGFAATAIVTLALGIGANTAIFSVCNAVLFKPLPYVEPSRLVTLWEHPRDGKPGTVAPANFVDWRNASRSFVDLAAVNSTSFIVGGQSEAARLAGGGASSSFFALLGGGPARREPRRDSQPPGLAGTVWGRPRDRGETDHAERRRVHRGRRPAGRFPIRDQRRGF